MVSLALDSKQLAETYDRVGERQFNHGKLLLEALQVKPGDHLLDVGCGTGRLAAHAAALVGSDGKVSAIDPLPLRVALAQKKGPPNLAASVGVAEDLSDFADDLLIAAGFDAVEVEFRSFVDHFGDAEAVIAFNQASSFGNFLSNLPSEQRALLHSLLEVELEKRRDESGIRLQRNLSFALGRCPG